jgi:hypothetical protein
MQRTPCPVVCVAALLLVSFAWTPRLCTADGEAGHRTVEPSPPDLLQLVEVPGTAAPASVRLEAVLRPVVDGTVDLEIVSPPGLRFASTARSLRFTMSRRGASHREPLVVNLQPQKLTVVRVRATVLDESGRAWLQLDRELRFNEGPPDPARQRVPVVHVGPDGSRRVEYMERAEAQRRGLLPSRPTGAPEKPPAEPALGPGGDVPDAPGLPQ